MIRHPLLDQVSSQTDIEYKFCIQRNQLNQKGNVKETSLKIHRSNMVHSLFVSHFILLTFIFSNGRSRYLLVRLDNGENLGMFFTIDVYYLYYLYSIVELVFYLSDHTFLGCVPGSRVPSQYDGCNTCLCGEDGSIGSCTIMLCSEGTYLNIAISRLIWNSCHR